MDQNVFGVLAMQWIESITPTRQRFAMGLRVRPLARCLGVLMVMATTLLGGVGAQAMQGSPAAFNGLGDAASSRADAHGVVRRVGDFGKKLRFRSQGLKLRSNKKRFGGLGKLKLKRVKPRTNTFSLRKAPKLKLKRGRLLSKKRLKLKPNRRLKARRTLPKSLKLKSRPKLAGKPKVRRGLKLKKRATLQSVPKLKSSAKLRTSVVSNPIEKPTAPRMPMLGTAAATGVVVGGRGAAAAADGSKDHVVAIPKVCGAGMIGAWPDCTPVVSTPPRACPPNTTGIWPRCETLGEGVPQRCPAGSKGKWPDCRPIVAQTCPVGTFGRYPFCRTLETPRCAEGTQGKWPNCTQVIIAPPGATLPPPSISVPPSKTTPDAPSTPSAPEKSTPKSPSSNSRPAVIAASPPLPVRPEAPRAAATAPTGERRSNEVVVLIEGAQSSSVASAVAQQYSLTRLSSVNNLLLDARIQRFGIPDQRGVDDVLGAMRGDARIAFAQPNHLYRLRAGEHTSSGGEAGTGRDMQALQYALGKLRLGDAHALSTGETTTVAVIDSQIDATHPELTGSLAKSFDAVGDGKGEGDDHGTAIAGIIAARDQLKGVAPAAKLLAARAFFREAGEDGNASKPLTTTFVLLKALDWAHANGARIFNLSFAGPEDKAVSKALNELHRKGAVLLAAAGNGGPDAPQAYPAAYDSVIGVTALDAADQLYAQANRGGHVAIAAPGVDILAPVPGRGYDFKSGTSFATAHVSGLVALMLERDRNLTAADVRNALTSGAVDLGPAGPDAGYGAGRVDAMATLQAARALAPLVGQQARVLRTGQVNKRAE